MNSNETPISPQPLSDLSCNSSRDLSSDDLVGLGDDHAYPIREIDDIQPYGIILAIHSESLRVEQASANTQAYLAWLPQHWWGDPSPTGLTPKSCDRRRA